MRRHTGQRWALMLAAAALPCGLSVAQPAETTGTAPGSEVTLGERGSDQDPLSGREPAVSVEPVQQNRIEKPEPVGLPSLGIKLDKRVLGIAPGGTLPPLRREGESLRKRDGRLLPTGDRGYAVFIADADPAGGDEQPVAMVLSPCMTLEAMERLYEDRGDALRFTVTGIVHTYRGVNYLLPTSQPRPWLIADERKAEPGETSTTDAAEGDTKDGATESASPEEGDQPSDNRTPTADEVLDDLLKQRDDTPRASDTAKGADPDSGSVGEPASLPVAESPGRLTDPLLLGLDPDKPQAELKPEGQFIIARAGRLIRSANGSHALFVLDADKRGAPEPPLILHACKLLETMEQTVLKEGEDVPFIITGQVFVYRGANYLLPTIVTREFERGNLE